MKWSAVKECVTCVITGLFLYTVMVNCTDLVSFCSTYHIMIKCLLFIWHVKYWNADISKLYPCWVYWLCHGVVFVCVAYYRALACPWKSLNLTKTPWTNQLILKKVFQMTSFWPQMCIKSIFGRALPRTPLGEFMTLIYAYKSAGLM